MRQSSDAARCGVGKVLAVLASVAAPCFAGAPDATLFRGVNVVPMTSETVLADQDVLVHGSKIVEIGPSGTVDAPAKAEIIDGKGDYLMPGLADMHVHLMDGWPGDQMRLYVANGVTTVRDMDGKALPFLKAEASADGRVRPTVLGTSPSLWGSEKSPSKLVAKHKKAGYRAQKINSYLSPRDFKKVMKQVKKHELYSACHIPFRVGLDTVIAEKMDEIAHIEELVFVAAELDGDDPRLRDKETEAAYIIEAFHKKLGDGITVEALMERIRPDAVAIARKVRAAGLTIGTTLATNEFVAEKVTDPDATWARPYAAHYHPRFRSNMEAGRDGHRSAFSGNEASARDLLTMARVFLVELDRAGVDMVLGTDAGPWFIGTVPGFSVHDELRIMTECGLSPYAALSLATTRAAKVAAAMKADADFGTIEVGKRADLILVSGNPLKDVAVIQGSRGVMVAGKWYAREALDRLIALGK